MCTAIVVEADDGAVVMGRTMDFSYPLSPVLYTVKTGESPYGKTCCGQFTARYSFFGMGQEIPKLVFADGVNEMGLCVAALYFPGYVKYDSYMDSENADYPDGYISATEVVGYLLGTCSCVEQAESAFNEMKIIGTKDSVTNTVTPLHWLAADSSGRCITVEKTESGLHCYENNYGVLTNSPDFKWHEANLRNYINVSSEQRQESVWNKKTVLKPFGQGAGTIGLPGDFTPPGRFVRAAWLKAHAQVSQNATEAVKTGFHILECISIPKGCVITQHGGADYTQYTVFFNLTEASCAYKTYDDSAIKNFRLTDSFFVL